MPRKADGRDIGAGTGGAEVTTSRSGPGGRALRRHTPKRYARRRFAPDQGVSTIELAGVLVVVAAIVVAVSGLGLAGTVADRVSCAVSSIVGEGGGNCGSSSDEADDKKTDEDYRPDRCKVSAHTETVSNEAKILWFTVGDKFDFKMEEFNVEDANGNVSKKYHMTFVNGDSAGAEFKAGGGAKAGGEDAEAGAKASVSIGGDVEISQGNTWVFDSEEEALSFRDDLQRLHEAEESAWTKPGWKLIRDGWREHVSKSNPELRDRISKSMELNQIDFRSVELSAGVEGNLAGPAVGDDIEVGASGSIDVAGKMTVTDDHIKNTTTETYGFSLEGELQAEIDAGVANAGAYAGQKRNGAIGVTRDADSNELQKITITRTVDTKAGAEAGVGAEGDKKGPDGEKDSGSTSVGGQIGDTEVVTTTLDIPKGPEGDEMRKTAEDWLNDPSNAAKPFETAFMDPSPTERPKDANDKFGNLLFEEAESSKVTYDSVESKDDFGFELNVMASLGYNRTMTETDAKIRTGDYLGAPAPEGDSRRYIPNQLCEG
ncbi:hypothetical protein DSC45_02930 [Streptomyces sp. YIM 130001]|uniref:hypothetical protein n=1 Tax=Streptomyces sp. YIM 130001 TaxID=2259644 RepID=UPI000ECB4978|nr:hypothetical protein [Streptomyces sp. YIM 130001]RII20776.1 hypothetical protein DSC45_02930 [Streptomyces sp. YIM 130001]